MAWLYHKYSFLLTLAAVGALVGSMVAEYIFEMQPCLLCVYQRYFWIGLLVFSVFFSSKRHGNTARRKLFLGCYCLALGIFSNYQVLVEEKILPAPQACRSQIPLNLSADDMWDHLQKAPVRPPCDQESRKFFGLSLAAYSGLIALVLAFLGFLGWIYDPQRIRKNRRLRHASSR